MINLRKYKYVVIADGTIDKFKPNVIACENLNDAQEAFKQAIEKNLDPHIREMAHYLSDSVLDRYNDPGEPTGAWAKDYEERKTTIKSLYDKLKNGV
jgi:hypothetical protein